MICSVHEPKNPKRNGKTKKKKNSRFVVRFGERVSPRSQSRWHSTRQQSQTEAEAPLLAPGLFLGKEGVPTPHRIASHRKRRHAGIKMRAFSSSLLLLLFAVSVESTLVVVMGPRRVHRAAGLGGAMFPVDGGGFSFPPALLPVSPDVGVLSVPPGLQ